ncbi:hypothetical protein CDAR_123931 [Caerostris darwini]|uniref:Uncharacterized protein n=1 Tax=Caerostris darwini TaxID=1538125 RepID=A0AAV4W1F1_9ARAC|nr:hypothetical protein CDAR_123931 [Caerostris darwini]
MQNSRQEHRQKTGRRKLLPRHLFADPSGSHRRETLTTDPDDYLNSKETMGEIYLAQIPWRLPPLSKEAQLYPSSTPWKQSGFSRRIFFTTSRTLTATI